MSKQHSIRWTDSQKKQFARSIKTYNQRIDRINAKHPELAAREKVSARELKAQIKTANDLRKILQELSKPISIYLIPPKIKWTESQEKKLSHAVKSFNQKIERLSKKHPELKPALPQKKSVRELRERIFSGKELSQEVNDMNRFIKNPVKVVSSETGNMVTNWELHIIKRKVAAINRQRKKEAELYNNLDVTLHGVDTGLKRAEMGSERMNQFNEKQFYFNKIRAGKEWQKFVESVDKQAAERYSAEKMAQFKANYIQGLERVFGNYSSDLIQKLQKVSASKIVETFMRDQEASIDFIYEPLLLQAKFDIIEAVWENALGQQ